MKRLLAAALSLTLLDAGGALAQDDHHDKGHPAPAAHPAGHPGGGWAAPAQRGAPAPQMAQPAPRTERSGPYPYVPQGHGDVPHMGGAPGPAPAPQHGARFGAPGFAPSGGDRPRYDPQFFPQHVRPAQRFRWSSDHAWAPQPGFYPHHWRYGDYLPEGWFAPGFWIYDYDSYSLPVPPYGYEWVRYGADALLVDTYSGEVVETVYGLFY